MTILAVPILTDPVHYDRVSLCDKCRVIFRKKSLHQANYAHLSQFSLRPLRKQNLSLLPFFVGSQAKLLVWEVRTRRGEKMRHFSTAICETNDRPLEE